MILSAQTIRAHALEGRAIISPFHERTKANGMTFGLGPAGYDIRAAEDITLGMGDFRLGSSMEEFNMPTQVLGYVKDKSSWARQGLCVQNTVIEPGWKGFLTLEYTNHSCMMITIRKGDPIAQIVFHWLDYETVQPYFGKYQNQPAGPQNAIKET